MKIAVVGTGYVGLSNAMLLAQHNEVVAVDIIPEKIELLNAQQSPIEDEDIEDCEKHFCTFVFVASIFRNVKFECMHTGSTGRIAYYHQGMCKQLTKGQKY